MPPFAEAAFLPRLNALSWAIRWREVVAESSDADRLSSIRHANDLFDLIDYAPETIPVPMVERCERLASGAALDALRDSAKLDHFTPQELGEMRVLLDRLTEVKLSESETQKLNAHQLRLASFESPDKNAGQDHFGSEYDRLNRAFATIENFEKKELLRAGLLRLSEESQNLEIALIFDSADADLSERVATVRAQIDQRVQKEIDDFSQAENRKVIIAREKYQRWALDQIREANKYAKLPEATAEVKRFFDRCETAKDNFNWLVTARYPAMRSILSKSTGVAVPSKGPISAEIQQAIFQKVDTTIAKYNYQDELGYAIVGEAIKTHLLAIDETLLDLPVAQLYRKAFDQGWNTLDDKPDAQFEIATTGITIPKKTLEQFANEE